MQSTIRSDSRRLVISVSMLPLDSCPPSLCFLSFAYGSGIHKLNAPCDAVCLVCAYVPPVQIMSHKIIREQQVIIYQQESSHACPRHHRRNFAPKRSAAHDADFSLAQRCMLCIEPERLSLAAE